MEQTKILSSSLLDIFLTEEIKSTARMSFGLLILSAC